MRQGVIHKEGFHGRSTGAMDSHSGRETRQILGGTLQDHAEAFKDLTKINMCDAGIAMASHCKRSLARFGWRLLTPRSALCSLGPPRPRSGSSLRRDLRRGFTSWPRWTSGRKTGTNCPPAPARPAHSPRWRDRRIRLASATATCASSSLQGW